MENLIGDDCYKNRFCPMCVVTFTHAGDLDRHLFQVHPTYFNYQHGAGVNRGQPLITFSLSQHAIEGMFVIYKANLHGAKYKDIDALFNSSREAITNLLTEELRVRGNLRVIFSIIGVFSRTNPITGETEITSRAEISTMRSFDHILMHRSMIPRILDAGMNKIALSVEEYVTNGSGYVLDHVDEFDIKISSYETIRGSNFIELPTLLKRKVKSLLNIRNNLINSDDDHLKCFLWSVLAHPMIAGITTGYENRNLISRFGNKVEYYKPHLHKLNIKGLTFPMTIEQIPKFEKLNPLIGITVLAYPIQDGDYEVDDCEKNEMQNKIRDRIVPRYVCTENRPIKVDLLLLEVDTIEGDVRPDHFVNIKNIVSLLRNPTNHGVKEICRNCLQNFQKEKTLLEHQKYCNKVQKTVFPTKENNILKFKSWDKTQKLPYIIYADFESILPRFEDEADGKTKRTHQHIAIGYSWICVDHEGNRVSSNRFRATTNEENVCKRFLYEIIEMCDSLLKRMIFAQIISRRTMVFDRPTEPQTVCCFCEEDFPHPDETNAEILNLRGPVRHHDHKHPFHFIGYAHNECNLLARCKTIIPVVMHNFQSYDSHFLVQAMDKEIVKKVEIIARSSEKFIAVKINSNIRFIDSFSFFPQSLAALSANLSKDDPNSFKLIYQEFGESNTEAVCRELHKILPHLQTQADKNDAIWNILRANHKSYPVSRQTNVELLLQKQSYPYAYMDSIERFDEGLPPPEAYFNDLTQEHISPEDYENHCKVWKELGLNTLGDLHDLYVVVDSCLLACVFEANRRAMLTHYQLDIAHYLSLPMLTKDAVLKMTRTKIELFSDPLKFLWIEGGIRGGLVSTGSLRCAIANNEYMPNYNPQLETSYLVYLDMNNLYGKALSELLPQKDFEWVEGEEFEYLNSARNIMNLEDENRTGYFFEVDLIIPQHLHVYLNDYPPAPVHRVVMHNQLSFFQNALIESENNLNGTRLIADLMPKNNMVCHYRNLKYWLYLGCQLVTVHKIMKFTQTRWFKSYIDFNTHLRKLATSEIERDLWKLCNNSAFGKMIERLRDRRNIIPILESTRGRRYNKKPTMQDFRIIHENLVLLIMRKLSVKLNNSIATGFSCLELSKLAMFQFHYGYIKPKFGYNAKLLYTDTDSLAYYIKYPEKGNVYEDFKKDEELFDLSEYNKNCPIWGKFHNNTNRKVLGRMKDEFPNCILTHFCTPKPKIYIVRFLRNQIDFLTGSKIYEEGEKKRAKGISKSVVQKSFTAETYNNALIGVPNPDVTMRTIRSFKHVLYTMNLQKKSISGLDCKRFCLPDYSTLAFGHKDIKE